MKCLICGNSNNFTPLSPEFCNTDNVLCMDCGLAFIPRGETSKGDYYKKNGYYQQSPNIGARKAFISRSLLVKLAKERVTQMLSIYPVDFSNKTVLDVGCGYGEILYYLKDRYNCSVDGIEPSKEAAALGEEMFSIPIAPLLLEEFEVKKSFDVIISNHTLEHVDNPEGYLRGIKDLLKPGGLLYIEAPNILWPSGGYDLKKFLYNEHLQTFSAYTLNELLNKCGLYTIAYGAENFLKFYCGKNGQESLSVKRIEARDILAFLKRYHDGYDIVKYARVNIKRLHYLSRLLYCKMLDLFE